MTADWADLPERGMIEVRALKPGARPQIAKFAPDWIDEAVSWIVDMNARGRNIYAVRNPVRQSCSGSATDSDIIAARFLWADCDSAEAAGNVYRFDGPKWTAAVTTGRTPTVRVHTYWRLTEWCHDLAAWRDMQVRIAAHFKSDHTVVNPSRIMRVGGTVSSPTEQKAAEGYVTELVTINTAYQDDRQPVSLEQMGRVFPPVPAAPLLSQMAVPSAPAYSAPPAGPGMFQIDTGTLPTLDRDAAVAAALSGTEWHNNMIRLVGSYLRRGLTDAEIHALTQPLTLPGYTPQQTAQEVQQAIDGARRKGWAPEAAYASPAALTAPQTPMPQAEAAQAPDPRFDAPARPRAKLEWFDDVQPALTDAYIVKGVLSQGAMSVIYGPSNSGKTFFAFDMAFHIAIGAPWRGRRVAQAGVLYLAAEGGQGAANRIAALREATGVCDVPLALRRAGLDLLHDQANLQEVVDLAAEVKARKPGAPILIVVDTLSRVMAGGDENSAQDMTALIRNIDAIRELTGAHVCIVHHTGKDTARGARGHSSLRAATDTEIEIMNENGARAAMVTKQRDYQGGETFAFTLKSVVLGTDQDGDDITSCIVEAQDDGEFEAARNRTKGLGGVQKIIADTFDQMLGEGLGKPNPGGVGMPESGQFWTVERAELRRLCMGKIESANPRNSFNVAFNVLTGERGLFCTGENVVWRVDRRITK